MLIFISTLFSFLPVSPEVIRQISATEEVKVKSEWRKRVEGQSGRGAGTECFGSQSHKASRWLTGDASCQVFDAAAARSIVLDLNLSVYACRWLCVCVCVSFNGPLTQWWCEPTNMWNSLRSALYVHGIDWSIVSVVWVDQKKKHLLAYHPSPL